MIGGRSSRTQKLKAGESISITSKNERLVPRKKKDNAETPTPRLPLTIDPNEVIILEGYLSLYNTEVRKLIDHSFYLEAVHDTRIKRRTNFLNPDYEQKVLKPMHEQYVEPTKKFADQIIDVSSVDINSVVAIIEKSWQIQR